MTTAISRPADAAGTLDRAALEALFQKTERRVYNVVYRWLWNADDASDCVQDAFAKLWAMRERVRMDTVEPLLFRIAVNTAASKRRRRVLWRFVGLDDVASDAALQVEQRGAEAIDAQRRVRRAVDALPEKLRAVVVLGESGGLSQREVAAALDIPEGTVASRRSDAAARLRVALSDLMEVGRE